MQNFFFRKGLTSLFLGLAASLGLSQTAQAQTIAWGAGSSNTRLDSIGRFTHDGSGFTTAGAPANSVWLPDLGWICTNRATLNPSEVWDWVNWGSDEPEIETPSAGPLSLFFNAAGNPISSTNGGFVYFNSDSLGYSTPVIVAAPQQSVITSPSIDLTAFRDSFLVLEFVTDYLNFQGAHTVRVRNNVTQQNLDFDLLLLTGVSSQNQIFSDTVRIPLAGLTSAADLSDFQVSFRFSGDSYYWAIDDVCIKTGEAIQDVAVGTSVPPADPNRPLLIEGATYARVSNNFATPLSQVVSDEFFYAARVQNIGSIDVIPSDSLELRLNIEYNRGGTWVSKYQSSVSFPNLPVGTDTLPDANFLTWLPDSIGEYRATYSVRSLRDNVSRNDTVSHRFNITDNYFSKIPTSTAPQSSFSFNPPFGTGADTITAFEVASVFYVPNGTGPNGRKMQLDSVRYQIVKRGTINASITSVPVEVRVYRLSTYSQGGLIEDNGSNLQGPLAIGTDTIRFSSSTQNQTFNRSVALVDATTLENFEFNDTSAYVISLRQENVAGLYIRNGGTTLINGLNFTGVTDESYLYNFFLSPATANSFRVTTRGTNNWDAVGFSNVTHAIGMNIKEADQVSVEPRVGIRAEMSLFPNPAKHQLNMQISLGEMQKNVQYNVLDVNGRVVRKALRGDISEDVYGFDLQGLPAGVYFVNVSSELGLIQTQTFVKQ